LGKVLIATGILMFGFVAYQLWGTGIETARAQSKLRGDFDEQIAAATDDDAPAIGIDNWVIPTVPPETSDSGSGADPADVDPASADETATPADDGASSTDDSTAGSQSPEADIAAPLGEPSDVVPGGVDLTGYAVEQNVPVVPDEAFARLEIPSIGTSHHVVPGVTVNDLKKGPGHYPDTPLPGQLGNASIAGHRTTYGEPFMDLDDLVPGDEIIVTMITGDRFVYRVTRSQVVSAADSWVITTRDPSVAELTLTTCHPKYTARDRLVIHSVLVPEKSAQVGVAEFYDFDEPVDAAPIPGDDPTFAGDTVPEATSADSPVADDATPAIVDADTADAEEATPPVADDSASVEAAPEADPAGDAIETSADESTTVESVSDTPVGVDPDQSEIDAFSQGWFDDREAFPQSALWGSVLTLISLLAYQLSKKTRHDSIGFLVGIAPFLIALYFFFQNINRLLPPGL
jgi:sortase A